jgi:hypothetical protein
VIQNAKQGERVIDLSFFDRIRGAISGERMCSPEHLEGYRRLSEQVYTVEVEVVDCTTPKALALLNAAKCFRIMGQALLRDAFPTDERGSLPVPVVTHEQAELWFGSIPSLLVAARQEASYSGSTHMQMPIRIGKRIEAEGKCPMSHLAGMRRAAEEVEHLFKDRLEHARLSPETHRNVILLYEEARTMKQTADAIVGSIMQGQQVSDESHEEAESKYWMALSDYLLIAQGLEDSQFAEQSTFRRPSGYASEGAGSFDMGPTNQVGSTSSHQHMDFEKIESQAVTIQQHNQKIVEQLQQVLTRIQTLNVDDGQKQEIAFSIRELALSVKGLNQETTGMVQSMALYIQHLESEHPQSEQYQQRYPRYAAGGLAEHNRSYSSGGFWDTIVRSAEMGAGFEIGQDIVDGLFNIFD